MASTLRSARLTGDPVLEDCLAGLHRMMAGEDGLPVMRLQRALLDLGRSVGAHGADGSFGSDVGDAVVAYKTDKHLVPNDAVVGLGTTGALDKDLFFDPAVLDPTFAEFSPFVVDHRLEQFVALELSAFLAAPLDSWRHMLGRFALTSLMSGQQLGMAAKSRTKNDLKDRFLAVANPAQGGRSADMFFDASLVGNFLGTTAVFKAGSESRFFIWIDDTVFLGRASIKGPGGRRALLALQEAVVHEMTHGRNIDGEDALNQIQDTDANAYADPALAVARTAASGPTNDVLGAFVAEIVARHVTWITRQELAGTPGTLAVRALSAEDLAAAALFYFRDVPSIYDSNQYGAGINAQGDAARFRQLELWLRLCATQSFSDVATDNAQSVLAFQAAAQVCADQVANPTLDINQMDGLFPLAGDFV